MKIKKEIHLLDKQVDKVDRKFNKIGDRVEKDVNEVGNWVIERRKFFIKFGWVVILIFILLVIASYIQ